MRTVFLFFSFYFFLIFPLVSIVMLRLGFSDGGCWSMGMHTGIAAEVEIPFCVACIAVFAIEVRENIPVIPWC